MGNSDKISVIDKSTFSQIQQHSSSTRNVRKIQNAKYRKKHKRSGHDFISVDWMTLIAASNIRKCFKSSNRAFNRKRATLAQQKWPCKKSGKVREKHQKKLTRLKKCIMKNRTLRHAQEEKQQNTLSVEDAPNDKSLFELSKETVQSEACDCSNLQQVVPSQVRLASISDRIREITLQDVPHTKPSKSIHSRKFREYCDNCTTPELAELCKDLLINLNRFHQRAYQKNPIKANAHRRMVLGFRQVQTNLRVNKIKLVLIATDCEKCDLEGGIEDEIEAIKTDCKSLKVPYAFPMQRRQLAYTLKKNNSSVSCVGILDYDGCRDKFTQLLQELDIARDKYNAQLLSKP